MSRRRVVLQLLFALAEASAIEPLLLLLPTPLRAVDSGVALAVTWALLSAIAFTRRALARRDASSLAQRAILGAWLVGMLVISVFVVNKLLNVDPRSLSILSVEFLGVLIVWWRGTTLGVADFGPEGARVRLQLGLLMFVMFALATMLTPDYNLLIFLLPFLLAALFAMPLSHIERVEQSEFGRPVPMDARWWRALGFGVGVPLFASMVATVAITGDALAAGLRLILAVLLIPIIAVALVVGYVITLLLSLLFNGTRRNPLEGLQGLTDLLNQLRARPDQATGTGINIPPDLRFALGLLVLAVIIVVVVYMTGRARREAAQLRADSEDLQDLGPAEPPPPEAPEAGFWRSFNLRRWLAVLTIRRIYARMSHEAGKRGYKRLAAQTPFDYAPRVCDAFPGADADIRAITNAYVAAHYGEVPDTDEALAQIKNAWERVRTTPRQRAVIAD